MSTLALDPGYRNLAMCLFDGDRATVFHMDFGDKPTRLECYTIAEDFCEQNHALMLSLKQFAIEEQSVSKETFKNIQEAFVVTLAKKFPQLLVRVISPKTTRAYWGTSVKKTPGKGTKNKKDYAKRKSKSVALLPSLMTPERLALAKSIFPKLDDIAEASLLAIYAHKVPHLQRKRPATGAPTMTQMSFALKKN